MTGAHERGKGEGGRSAMRHTFNIKIKNLSMLHVLLKIGKTTKYLAKKTALIIHLSDVIRLFY